MDRIKAEEKTFPKGTKLLPENERKSTLERLCFAKNDLLDALDKLPLSLKTLNLQTKKIEIDRKLNDIESAIRTFSMRNVFVKA